MEESTAPSVLEAVDELDSVKEVFIIGEHPGCTPVEQLMLEGSTYIQLILLLEKFNFENLLKLSKSIIFLKMFPMSNWKCCADGEIDFGNESNPEFDPELMAWLTHSSGTTGIPKTIVHPYKNISKLVTFYRWVTEYFNIYFIFRLKFMSKVLVIFFPTETDSVLNASSSSWTICFTRVEY